MRSLEIPPELIAPLRGNVLILSGAGISVASGLRTFRGDDGLYEGLNPYDLATPGAFDRHPVTVWNWYLMRIRQGQNAKPNPAHTALVEWERKADKLVIVTSNVDPLHEQAGSSHVFKLHGDILQTRCVRCGEVAPLGEAPERVEEDSLPRCPCEGRLRPNVVWFGEQPRQDAIHAAMQGVASADAVIEVGSSGVVSYGFTEMAARNGAVVLRVNPDAEPWPGIVTIPEPAEDALPNLVERL
jgi:NAD-dependent deacetylase